MAALTEIYMKVSSICLKDDKGVYLNDEKIALDNGFSNCYIRRNGEMTLTKEGNTIYQSSMPLKLIGAYPGGDTLKLERATLAALNDCNNLIVSSEIDKVAIAESEGIDLEDLAKFDGVALVMITYNDIEKKTYDIKCDYDLC